MAEMSEWFDPDLDPSSWFDPDLAPQHWWDHDLFVPTTSFTFIPQVVIFISCLSALLIALAL